MMPAPDLNFDAFSSPRKKSIATILLDEMRAYYSTSDNKPWYKGYKKIPSATLSEIAQKTIDGFDGNVPDLLSYPKTASGGLTEEKYEEYKQTKNRELLLIALNNALERFERYSIHRGIPLDDEDRTKIAKVLLREMIENGFQFNNSMRQDQLRKFTFFFGAGAETLIDKYNLSAEKMGSIVNKQPASPENLLKKLGHHPKDCAANDHGHHGQT